jgi:hypothetical protein
MPKILSHYLERAQNGHPDIVTLLLSSGITVDILNSDNKSPFDLALDNVRLDVARSLAERLNIPDEWRNSLHTALEAGHLEIVWWLLLEVGVDINERDKKDHRSDARTPLCCASAGGSFGVAKLLIQYGRT